MAPLYRYPLPMWAGGILGALTAAVTGTVTHAVCGSVPLWAMGLCLVVGIVTGVPAGAWIWFNRRLWCAWVAVMWTPSWKEHANAAGLQSRGAQEGPGGRRDLQPRQIAKIRVRPHISKGALWVPVKTNAGELSVQSAGRYARDLADVLGLAGARAQAPQRHRGENRGYVWFVLSEVDETL